MITDGKKGKGYDVISAPMYSPDSSRFGYIAKQGNQFVFVENDKAGAIYEVNVSNYSPDSKQLAYTAKKDDKWFMVKTEKKARVTTGLVSPSSARTHPSLLIWRSKAKRAL